MSGQRISTWGEVRAHLRAIYADLEGDGDGPLEMTVGGDAVAHLVRVRQLEAEGAAWIEVLGVMGTARHVSQVSPLANNYTAAIGVCGVTENQLAMRQILPLAGLRVEDLDETVQAIAFQCAWGRQVLGPG